MSILYIVSKYATVIGSILKGFWEHLVCRMLRIPVSDARYLQANELCGHAEHDFTNNAGAAFCLAYIPGLMNRIFGYGMIIGSFAGLFIMKVGPTALMFWFYIVMLYIGVSLMCNNAPLYEDAVNNWELLYGKESKVNIIAKIFAFIPSVYILISAWMEKYAISFIIYVVAIAVFAII